MFFKLTSRNAYRDLVRNARRICVADMSEAEKSEAFQELYNMLQQKLGNALANFDMIVLVPVVFNTNENLAAKIGINYTIFDVEAMVCRESGSRSNPTISAPGQLRSNACLHLGSGACG